MSPWTLDTEGTMLSKLEWQLTAAPAGIAERAQDDVELMMELPCCQGLHGQKPHAPNSHRICPTDPTPVTSPSMEQEGHTGGMDGPKDLRLLCC